MHLLDNSDGPSVLGSKAVGEPPLFLGCSVYFAILEAVNAYNKNQNKVTFVDSPLTGEKIRLACIDDVINPLGVERLATVGGSFQEVQHWHARV